MKNLLIVCLLSFSNILAGYDIVALRDAYENAAKTKKGLHRLQALLKSMYNNHDPVLQCYQGASEMVAAKYAVNPINKLNAFVKGKKMIEQSINSGTAGIECYFIRYGIQRNLPAILNYHDDRSADSVVIVKCLDTVRDQDLKNRIVNYMKLR